MCGRPVFREFIHIFSPLRSWSFIIFKIHSYMGLWQRIGLLLRGEWETSEASRQFPTNQSGMLKFSLCSHLNLPVLRSRVEACNTDRAPFRSSHYLAGIWKTSIHSFWCETITKFQFTLQSVKIDSGFVRNRQSPIKLGFFLLNYLAYSLANDRWPS